MQRTDSFEKALMLGKIEGRRIWAVLLEEAGLASIIHFFGMEPVGIRECGLTTHLT